MLKDTNVLFKMFKSSNHHENLSSDYDNTHYNRLMSLIEISQKKGIHLVSCFHKKFISRPCKSNANDPEKNKLNMALTSEKIYLIILLKIHLILVI